MSNSSARLSPVEGPDGPADGSTRQEQDRGIDPWALLAILVEQRRPVLLTALAVLLVGVALLIIARPDREYQSSAAFYPQESSGGASSIAGLARQFGVATSGAGGGESPAFYAGLIRSRRLLARIASAEVPTRTERGVQRRPLRAVLAPDVEADSAVVEQVVVRRLRDAIQVNVGRETGVVSYSVVAPDPLVAYFVADRLLELIHEFNLTTRQSRAAAERRFAESRLENLTADLAEAEAELAQFLESNRQFQSSPDLVFRHDKLRNTVQMRQGLVNAMAQAVEEAKIEEVRNTPVVTVLEEPEIPPRPRRRPLLVLALVLVLLAGAAGLVVGLIRGMAAEGGLLETRGRMRLRAAVGDARGEIRSVRRRLRGG